MSNYTILIKNYAKTDLKKIQKSQHKSQFFKIIETSKIALYYSNQSLKKF